MCQHLPFDIPDGVEKVVPSSVRVQPHGSVRRSLDRAGRVGTGVAIAAVASAHRAGRDGGKVGAVRGVVSALNQRHLHVQIKHVFSHLNISPLDLCITNLLIVNM